MFDADADEEATAIALTILWNSRAKHVTFRRFHIKYYSKKFRGKFFALIRDALKIMIETLQLLSDCFFHNKILRKQPIIFNL